MRLATAAAALHPMHGLNTCKHCLNIFIRCHSVNLQLPPAVGRTAACWPAELKQVPHPMPAQPLQDKATAADTDQHRQLLQHSTHRRSTPAHMLLTAACVRWCTRCSDPLVPVLQAAQLCLRPVCPMHVQIAAPAKREVVTGLKHLSEEARVRATDKKASKFEKVSSLEHAHTTLCSAQLCALCWSCSASMLATCAHDVLLCACARAVLGWCA